MNQITVTNNRNLIHWFQYLNQSLQIINFDLFLDVSRLRIIPQCEFLGLYIHYPNHEDE